MHKNVTENRKVMAMNMVKDKGLIKSKIEKKQG